MFIVTWRAGRGPQDDPGKKEVHSFEPGCPFPLDIICFYRYIGSRLEFLIAVKSGEVGEVDSRRAGKQEDGLRYHGRPGLPAKKSIYFKL